MMARSRGALVRIAALVLVAAAASGCASVSKLDAVDSLAPPASTPSDASAPPSPCDRSHEGERLSWSYRPPDPGNATMPSTAMAIVQRGFLRVGVDQNTLLLSYRDPTTNKFQGFEIDVLRAIARRLFPGDDPTSIDDRLHFVPVNTAQKLKVVETGDVDFTISAATPTCSRWSDVAFTTPYYLAHQKVLMRTDAQDNAILSDGTRVPRTVDLHTLDELLAGRNVCWTKGSTSIDNIARLLPSAKPYIVDTRTDCLMALQDGVIDAVSTDDTFLLGYEEQDPSTTMLDLSLSEQPYGIVVQHDDTDFVRYLNAQLLQLRTDGTLQDLYAKNFDQCERCNRHDVPMTMPELTPGWID